MDVKFLDDRIGEQLRRQLGGTGWQGARSAGLGGVVYLDLKSLSLPDRAHFGEAEPAGGPSDRLPLRVVDLWLEHDIDNDPDHMWEGTRLDLERVAPGTVTTGV